MPSAPNARVLVSGQPVATMPSPYLVAGCAFVPPGGNGPCVTAQWLVAATRVFVTGQPAVLFDSQAICTPTGTPLLPVASQTRVIGS
jgi:hypothetical protein